MIYTSYFAQYKKLPQNIAPISIARITPKWFLGYEYKKLAPSWEILKYYKDTQDIQTYTHMFQFNLSKLNAKNVVKELYNLVEPYQDIVLLCYEKPETFCHRQIVAQWLTENGYLTQEIKNYGNSRR